MANVIINDTNLTNIANAIREKNGTTDTYKPSEMADAITNLPTGGGGGYMPTDKELVYDISSDFPFINGNNAWVMKEYGNKIVFNNCSSSKGGLISDYPYEIFDANPKFTASTIWLISALANSDTLKEITGSFVVDSQTEVRSLQNMFGSNPNLRTINDDFLDTNYFHWTTFTGTYNNARTDQIFYYCHSLREVPAFFFKLITNNGTAQPYTVSGSYSYKSLFEQCYTLNKIEGLPVISGFADGTTVTVNLFSSAFNNCHNLSKFTFDVNEDGTPKVANWNNQIIDLSGTYIGYSTSDNHMTGYNSGLTANGKISQPGPGQDIQVVYTDDKINDYWAAHESVAKFGHTEAVELINSLPDTSAAGGSNTIKFKGSQGYRTDYMKGRTTDRAHDSKISTLTDEEIAVATAKGWTVEIV